MNFRRSVIIAELWRPELWASPHTWLTLFQISSKSVHFRRSYCRTREDRFCPVEYLQCKLEVKYADTVLMQCSSVISGVGRGCKPLRHSLYICTQWLKYTFRGRGTLLKCGPLLCLGAPKLHDGPGKVTFDMDCFSQSTPSSQSPHTVTYMYTANNVKTAIQMEETDRQVTQLKCCMFEGPETCIPVKIYLFRGPETLTRQIRWARKRTAFLCVPAYFNHCLYTFGAKMQSI